MSGKFVVAGFTVLEFFGSSCIMLVVLWQEFVAILPNHSEYRVLPMQIASHPALMSSLSGMQLWACIKLSFIYPEMKHAKFCLFLQVYSRCRLFISQWQSAWSA